MEWLQYTNYRAYQRTLPGGTGTAIQPMNGKILDLKFIFQPAD